MKEKMSVIGGDLRISTLANLLAADRNQVYVYGMEKSNNIEENNQIVKCKNIEDAINASDIIIGSIPFSKNEEEMHATFSDKNIKIRDLVKNKHSNKIFIAGSIPKNAEEVLEGSYKKVVDVMKREELVILNTIATAEGAIEIAIKNTDKILHGNKILVLGFGRVAKVVAAKFYGLNTEVVCAARKKTDLAWIKTLGYGAMNINFLGEELNKFDIIINTVPTVIVNKKEMKKMKDDVLLIDLASNPGGFNKEDAKELNIKLICALALPGKVAPITSAEFIKESIYSVLEDI